MDSVPLGSRSGLRVSEIVLGTMARRGGSADERVSLFHEAVDCGITTFDTAPLYDFGAADEHLAMLLKSRRDEVVVATKVGLRWDDAHGEILFEGWDASAQQPRVVRRDSRPKAIRADLEASLRRLGVEYVDLVHIHHPDRSVPIEDAIGALLELRAEGKLRAIGVSNFDPEEVERARAELGDVPLASLQLRHNLIHREAESDLMTRAAEVGVGVLAYSPLAEGLLAGKYLHQRPSRRAQEADHHPVNAGPVTDRVRTVLEPMAARYGVSVAAIGLAWSRLHPLVSAPIVGVSRTAHLEAAVTAASLPLEPTDLEGLSRAFAALDMNPRAGRRRRDRLLRAPFGAVQRVRGWAGKVKRAVLR